MNSQGGQSRRCWLHAIYCVSAFCTILLGTPYLRAQESKWSFSADQIVTTNKKTVKSKIYASEKALRMESEMKGQRVISIIRLDRSLMWTLMPDQKIYMELPVDVQGGLEQAAHDPAAKTERELDGEEQVGPYQCIKSHVRITAQGQTYSGTEWAANELDNFVVKRFDEREKSTTEYQNIQLGHQDPSLFEIPPGYQKVGMPGGMPSPKTP